MLTLARKCESVVRATIKVNGKGKLWPPPPQNPSTDTYQNLRGWLRRGCLPPGKILLRPDKGFRFRACATSSTIVYSAIFFTARRSYASAVLGIVILSVCLSVCPSVRPSVRPSVTLVLCDQSKESTGDIFIPHERAILLVFCHLTVVGGRRPLPPLMGDRGNPSPLQKSLTSTDFRL